MAWEQQGYQFFNPDTNQYYIPQISGGEGQAPGIFGQGDGQQGTMGTPSGDLVSAPAGFDFWASQGRQAPGMTNAATGQSLGLTQAGESGMPTGKGYLSSTPFDSRQFANKDEGLLSQLQGLAILGPYAAAAGPGLAAGAAGGGAAGGGEFGGIFAPQNIPYLSAPGPFDQGLANLASSFAGGAAGGAGASGVGGGSPESLISPQTGQALGLPSPTGAPSPTGSPTTITPPGTPGGGAMAPGGAPSILGQGESFVDKILKQLKDNPLGAVGAGLTAASLGGAKKQPLSAPESTLSNLGAGAAGLSQTLIDAYKSGTLQPGQQAQLDQTIQGAKNQINQYFASIGQSNSTAHTQALAQIDQQALSMKQNMLNNMLQQGLSAMGAAEGPLGQVAQYQLGQDRNLQQAFGNFASALGNIAGRSSGSTAPTQNVSNTPATPPTTP